MQSINISEQIRIMEGNGRKVLQRQSRNKVMNDTKRKMRKSSSLGDLNTTNLNDSHVTNSRFMSYSPQPERHRFSTCGTYRENHLMESPVQENSLMMNLKCILLNGCSVFYKKEQNIQELRKRVAALQTKFEDAKADVHSSLNDLNQIYYNLKINQVEKERKKLLFGSEILQQPYFEQLSTLTDYEMNKIKLRNVSLSPKDDFSQTLNDAYNFVQAFKMNKEQHILENIVIHFGELKGALEKFKNANEGCGQLIERIKDLLLHRKVLSIIDAENIQK